MSGLSSTSRQASVKAAFAAASKALSAWGRAIRTTATKSLTSRTMDISSTPCRFGNRRLEGLDVPSDPVGKPATHDPVEIVLRQEVEFLGEHLDSLAIRAGKPGDVA